MKRTVKRTKIIATLGPATDDPSVLKQMIQEGVDVVRINFSHQNMESQVKRVEQVRQAATELDIPVGIIGDLQGPKIRVSTFKNDRVELVAGNQFILDASSDVPPGDENRVGLDYKELPDDVSPGDTLLLDDGKIVLEVKEVDSAQIHCSIVTGGILSNNKGINRKGGGLSAAALTDKDIHDLNLAASRKLDLDYVALSFPRDEQDIHSLRQILQKLGIKADIIAKIERTEAVNALAGIIEASDGVMVARGDLAVEIGQAEVPAVQKRIIKTARSMNKPVITATQMMESMIANPMPTRAEVSDVANAILDNADAVMMSAETAVGKYPVQVIKTLVDICITVEKTPETKLSGHRLTRHFNKTDEVIAMSAMYAANHADITAIVALTESGATPLRMSRIRTAIPIYALCRHWNTLGKMALFKNVYPIFFEFNQDFDKNISGKMISLLRQRKLMGQSDLALVTKGEPVGYFGTTNTMEIFGHHEKKEI